MSSRTAVRGCLASIRTANRSVARRQICTSAVRCNQASADRKTHFGYQTVTENEKEQRVAGVFTSVAESYDKMNDLMSFGVHRLWKYVLTNPLLTRDTTSALSSNCHANSLSTEIISSPR